MTIRLPAYLLLFTVIISGCSSSGGSVTRYYLVEPLPEPSTTSVDMSTLAIAVTDLSLPQYLEKFQIASRRDGNQLVFASSHQWAESLRKNLSRVLAINLSRLLGTPDVSSPTSRSASKPDVRISLSIENFERGPDGFAIVSARWQISSDKGLTTHSNTLRSDNRIDTKDYGGTVRALNQLFSKLSTEIAASIREGKHED